MTRRRVLLAVAFVAAVWLGFAVFLLVTANRDAHEAQRVVADLRNHQRPSLLLDPDTASKLRTAQGRFRRARDHLRSPILFPLRVLPVLGRQLHSAAALSSAGVQVLSRATVLLDTSRAALEGGLPPGQGRVDVLRRVGAAAADTERGIDGISLGPDDALIGPLSRAHDQAADDLGNVRTLLRRTTDGCNLLADILEIPEDDLLLVGNNAEMRAGGGMFLQVGTLHTGGGTLKVSDLKATSSQLLPGGAVALHGSYLDNWSFLSPGEDWRNLAMTPRFDATAPLAASMWQAGGNAPVGDVVAVDPYVLQAILQATGPVQVGDTKIGPQNVIDLLLHNQYKGLPATSAGDANIVRRERLGEITHAAFDALNEKGLDAATLLDALYKAIQERHLLAWSPNSERQQVWRSLGVSGELGANNISVAVSNVGGNKLDYFLSVSSTLDLSRRADGGFDGRLDIVVADQTPDGEAGYVAGPNPALTVQLAEGEYAGFLTVNLPGFASNGRVDGVDSLDVAGRDGETVQVATKVRVLKGATQTVTVRFELPPGATTVRLMPSARPKAVHWKIGTTTFDDDRAHTIRLR